jgi:hypothetical protein
MLHTISRDTYNDWKNIIDSDFRTKIHVIKRIREYVGCSLFHAKVLTDTMQDGEIDERFGIRFASSKVLFGDSYHFGESLTIQFVAAEELVKLLAKLVESKIDFQVEHGYIDKWLVSYCPTEIMEE